MDKFFNVDAGYEAGMLQGGAQAAVSGVVAAPEYYYPQVRYL